MGLISNGTTLLDAGAIDSGVPTGAMTLIKTLTASGASTLSFVHGASSVVLDSTYKKYVFKFINIHPSGNNRFQFNGSIDAGSNYNVDKTSTVFIAQHDEDEGEDPSLIYQPGDDLANATGFQDLMAFGNQDDDNDHNLNGTLQLFEPSSTVFVKHFTSITQANISSNYSVQTFGGGYFNNANDIDAIRFQMNSGNFDGIIKLYGIK